MSSPSRTEERGLRQSRCLVSSHAKEDSRAEGDLAKGRFPMRTGKGKPQQVEAFKGHENGSSVGKGREGRKEISGRRSARSLGRIGDKGLTSHYSMLIQWSDEDQVYVVTLPEFRGPKTHGETYEEAARMGEEVLELLIESAMEAGETLPEPSKFDSN